jgi:hypothetical protein
VRERDVLGDLGIDWRIILKCIFEWGLELDLYLGTGASGGLL